MKWFSFVHYSISIYGDFRKSLTKKAEKHLDVAQQMIDYLDMLKEKTYNNLDSKELDALNQTIYELKVSFLRVQNEEKEKGEVKKNESENNVNEKRREKVPVIKVKRRNNMRKLLSVLLVFIFIFSITNGKTHTVKRVIPFGILQVII